MKRLVITLAVAAVLLVACAAPAGASTAVWQPSTLATFSAGDYGAFLEGMAADSHGNLFGSLTTWGYYDETRADSNIGEVWRLAQNGKKRLVATMDLSPNGMLTGVTVDSRDRVYVALYDFGDPQTVGCGVYRVDPSGSMVKVIAIPTGSMPNGLAFRGDRAYVSVSDYGRIVHITVSADGSPGAPRIFCERPELVTADGIAFDARRRLWITTNSGTTGGSPSGALYRLSSSGALSQIGDDPGWLNYPVMPVFGTTSSTGRMLFIANGAYFDYEDGSAPDIQALPVSVPGLPLN